MSAIPGYPRHMPAKYEKWLPKFSGNDVVTFEEHMSNLWALFQLNPMSDDVEYLVMNIFYTTLLDVARRWHDSLSNAITKTMDQLEDIFLQIWSVKEDPNMLLT
jgi:hypothetical protein